ncbi:helix-turn-helix domain-containing protein [Streptomyces sp. NPDC049813]|uniref:helix-turn-helix domain-containing protein n=1 Tax=Streptomyces sp. NPDC049813 TaxID=3365597 RepID=UPI0037B4A774
MIEEEAPEGADAAGSSAEASAAGPRRASRPLPDHPVRLALLDLLAELGTVTSSQAAARLGHSSGLCSFHLRRLARAGLIEEAPHSGGRVRPWRLRWDDPRRAPRAPDRSVTATLHLTPDETADLADRIQELLAPFERRRGHPAGAAPVAVTARLRPER